jgi:NAD(P)-dependent dehydrogenase (short-subunit alcohol dehydrogenase family)
MDSISRAASLARESPRWTADDIPDLGGRVAIVTGASSGIGIQIALTLARRRAHVVVAARDDARTATAVARILRESPGATVEPGSLDLARLASVRAFAANVRRRHERVDILVNNAGVAGGPRRVTPDGFEMHFQVNHLGHFALTALLWPLLRARPGARVVSVSSEVASSGRIDFDDLQGVHAYGFVRAYAQSKLANLLFATELERRSRDAGAGVSSFACHPGVARTNLFVGKDAEWGRPRRGAESLVHLLQLLLAQSAERSALPALYQATEAAARPDHYVGPVGLVHGRGYPGRCALPRAALDQSTATRLWEISGQLSGVSYEGLVTE